MRAIIIAEDDAAIRLGSTTIKIDTAAILGPRSVEAKPERTLILGWNRRGPIIAYELSRYVAPGSILTVAADTPGLEQEVAGLPVAGDNLSVSCRITDTSSSTALASLDVPSYDHVLVLGYSEAMAAQPADTRTLVTLLHLRKIADDAGLHISIVSEMIDVRNRELAAVTKADDFVVSNRLVSLMLAQASENQYLAAIFDDLLDEQGSEIYMRPVADYVAIDQPLTFWTIAESARLRGEIAIGYRRIRAGDADQRALGGVTVNPLRSEALTYLPEDRIIVLARD
jgi:voltage-gated potassium channel Kch